MTYREVLASVGILTAALALSVGAQVSAYSAPTSAPPNSDANAPLHTGAAAQIKAGSLTVNTAGNNLGLYMPAGRVQVGDSTGYTVTSSIGLLLVNKEIRIIDATPGDDNGKVLVSNANGVGSWQTLPQSTLIKAGSRTGLGVVSALGFPDATYAVLLDPSGGSTDCRAAYVTSKTSSGFTIASGDACTNVVYTWVAVDY